MRYAPLALAVLLAAGCTAPDRPATDDFYGTLEPFAANAVYFVVTDRFVNGDPGNDHRDQGGAHPTFDVPLHGPDGATANVGYLGGDFRGLLDNADYIHGMGFGAVWITPIVDNPDEAFSGGEPARWNGFWTDGNKSGYHGYWGVNFYRLDEHLPSADLDFAGLTAGLKRHGLKTVLDIVCNHGSPAYTMPVAQPMFGKIYDKDGRLLADEQNLPPEKLDPAHNPLHAFYNTTGGLAQLSDLNENNPAVLDYLAGAYGQWLEQGADAFRIDTLGWMPDAFWEKFAARIRARHPGFFMFGEDFGYDPAKIAHHTWPGGGSISVLDFPLKQQLAEVFGKKPVGGYERLSGALYLEGGPYADPYALMTFYDNHDMARLDASDAGFIDANNWLFTARGIPVLYYGSEVGFERGRAEHAGNRNYFGQQRIDAAPQSQIYRNLVRIARLRAQSPALQRGLQLDLELSGDRAAFYRVYQHDGVAQTALVLLNKADEATDFGLSHGLQPGSWRDGFDGRQVRIDDSLRIRVPAHGVRVLFYDHPLDSAGLRARLAWAMAAKPRRQAPVD